MIKSQNVYEAWRKDRARHKRNHLGAGYLTRDERWAEVMRYCRCKDAQRDAAHSAALTAEYGPAAN